MTEYAKTPVNNVITVTSFVTALRADLRNRVSGDESHNFPEIFFISEGCSQTTVDGIRHTLKPGQMMICAANSVHGQATGGVEDIISFETAAPLPEQYCNRVITLTGEQRLQYEAIFQQALPLFECRVGMRGMVLKNHIDPYVVQSLKNQLELFLLNLMCPSEHYEMQKMNTVTDYMMHNIHRALTVEEICTDLGISASSLKRLAQQTCGKSPLAYFADLKVEQAKWLILHSAMNMTQISEQLGFSSVHYFSRVFRQKTGQTPSEYRKDPLYSAQKGSVAK